MTRVCSMFSQILRWFPRGEFDAAVREHKGERHASGFSCWQQFVAMLYCQLGHAQSLRELCGGLGSVEGKLPHLGILNGPKATTLSYANAHRHWQLYQGLFYTKQNITATMPTNVRALTSMPSSVEVMEFCTASISLVTLVIRPPVLRSSCSARESRWMC